MLIDRDRRWSVCRENAGTKTRQSARDKQECDRKRARKRARNAVGSAVGMRSERGRNRDRKRGRKRDERGRTQARRGVLYRRARTGSRCKHKARGKRNRTRDTVERTDTRLKRGNAEKMKDGERRRSNTNAARYHRDRNTGDGREK